MSDRAVFDGLVAIVDDDPSVRRALSRLFASVGIRAVTHDSGATFLASRALHDIDCLVLDVHMPGMSGAEVLSEVSVAASKLPVVLMTGRYDVDFEDRALSQGAAALLRKPFDDSDLFRAVEDATGTRLPGA